MSILQRLTGNVLKVLGAIAAVLGGRVGELCEVCESQFESAPLSGN